MPHVVLFGDGTFGRLLGLDEVTRVSPGLMGLVPLQVEIPENLLSLSLSVMWKYSSKVAIFKPGREPYPESDLASNLISDFQAPEM